MEIYTVSKTIKITDCQDKKLRYLKSKKINISRLIRDAIDKELLLHKEIPKEKVSFSKLKLLLNNSFPI